MFLGKRDHNISFYRSVCRWEVVALIACVLCVTAMVVALRWTRDRTAADNAIVPSLGETIPTSKADEEAGRNALVVLDGATRVKRGHGAYGSFYVAYMLTEEYPARNAIQQISSRLGNLGWTPLKEDWLNPGLPSSHARGWTDFGDIATSNLPRHVHQWTAQWQDSSGNIVDYSLRYSYPEGAPRDLRSLWINVAWYPVAGVKIMQWASEK